MSHIGAAIAEAHATHPPLNFAASSSSELPIAIGGTDLSGMPLVHDESDLPEPGGFWGPRSDAGFYCQPLSRRFTAAETEAKRHVYQERMQGVRDVMAACRSGDASTKMAAAKMTRSMSDLSNHENSPNSHLSWAGFCNTTVEVPLWPPCFYWFF